MKRILVVLPNDKLGGAEQILKMIACHFKNELVFVKFLTKKKSNGWENINQKITLSHSTFNSEYIGALGFIFSLLFISKKERFQYVFTSHVFITGLIGILIRIHLIKKDHFIGRESTLIFKRFRGFKLMLYKLMYKLGYPMVDLLICQTEDMKKELLYSLPNLQEATNIVVIPNPIDMNEIANKSTITIPINYGKFIVSAGRLIPEKGFDLLIDAFSTIIREYSEMKLVILGEGNQRDFLESLIKEKNLENKVVLTGFIPKVYPYFKAAEACVVASRVEGFPNVLLQMMSQNNKVVATKCAGGIENIPGLFVAKTNSVDSLEQAILNTLQSETSENRLIFDSYLKERSIEQFITTIDKYLVNA